MNRLSVSVAILLCTAFLASAGQSIATASSSASFELRGSLVNVAGVPSWPLVSGDEVAAKSSPVAISLPDGSRVTLSSGSHLRIDSTAGSPAIHLVSGSLQYSIVSGSMVKLFNSTTLVPGRSGTISVGAAPVGSNRSGVQASVLRPPPPGPISDR